MKRLLQTASLTALLLSSAAVLADPPGHHKHKKHHKHGNDHGYYDRGYYDRGRHDNGHHYGQIKKAYRRGDYVPRAYWEPRYYVDDYRVYHLAPPPRGYRWVRPVDDRYLLVEIATGVIAQALGY